MKNVFLATVAALGVTATAASADELTVLGGVEYATEAEVIETTLGVEYAPSLVSGLTLTPMLTMNDAGQDFALSTVELTVAYEVVDGVSAYATVEGDDEFSRTETSVGVAFRF